jgi:phosphoserine phosphatase
MLILDLDGTILSLDSFRRWALYLACARFPHLGAGHRLSIACATVRALSERKMRLTGHEALKWRLQKLWQAATDGDGGASERRFVEELLGFVRPELLPVLKAVAAGEVDAVMATAAAGDYAYGLGKSLGFTHILATDPMRAAAEPSNVGERKRQAVMDLIASRGWQDRPRILFTDHEDDLPLIRICQTVYWFGSDRERSAIQRIVPGIRLHPGLSGSYDTAYQGWADGRAGHCAR